MTPELPKRIERINYLLTGVLGAVGMVFLSTPYALGLVVGALISALHFSGLRWIVDNLRRLPAKQRKGFGMLLIPHLLVTMGAVIGALLWLPLSAGAMLVGFSIFLISIVAGTIQDSISPDEEESLS